MTEVEILQERRKKLANLGKKDVLVLKKGMKFSIGAFILSSLWFFYTLHKKK